MASSAAWAARASGVILAILVIGGHAAAQGRTDVVTLPNGDRITGEVVRLDRGRLEFKTDDAGTLYLEWDKVATVQATRAVEVVTEDGRRFLGSLGPAASRTLTVVGRGRERLRRHGGRHHHPADRQQLLEQARWQLRRRLQLHALERRRPAQRQLGHVLSHARGARAPDPVAHPDAQGRRLRDRRSRLARGLVPALPVAALVRLGGGPVRDQQEPRASSCDRRSARRSGRVSSTAIAAQLGLGAGLVVNDEQGVDVEPTQNVEALVTLQASYYTYDRPRTNLDLSVVYYPSLSDPGRRRLQLDAGAKRELWKDFFVALHPVQHLRQPSAQSGRGYERRRRRGVDRVDLLTRDAPSRDERESGRADSGRDWCGAQRRGATIRPIEVLSLHPRGDMMRVRTTLVFLVVAAGATTLAQVEAPRPAAERHRGRRRPAPHRRLPPHHGRRSRATATGSPTSSSRSTTACGSSSTRITRRRSSRVNLWYHVGSRNEQRGKTGFAHLFEHFFFNGSEHHPSGFREAMDDLGANNRNGTTSTDRTNFFENVPVSALERTLFLEADRMGFLAARITKESWSASAAWCRTRSARARTSRTAECFRAVSETLYPAAHPYSWSTIGSMADLDAATLDDVKEWYRTYYGPNNCVLSLAGDITPERALALVKKYFDGIPPGPPLRRAEPWVPRFERNVRDEMEDRVPQALVYRVYHAPGWRDADAPSSDARGRRAERLEERPARSAARLREEPGRRTIAPASIDSEIASTLRRPGDCSSPASIRRRSSRRSTRWSRPSSPTGPTAAELQRAQSRTLAELRARHRSAWAASAAAPTSWPRA